MAEIKYLKHKEIDKVKWDNAIDLSYNALVYPYAFFLDSMAEKHWDALVLNDYEAVFPLVWSSKFGFKFLYQPYFCQQLGLFSKTKITEALLKKFLDKIPSKFRYWHFHLNYENKYYSPDIRFVTRRSFCIDLDQNYTDLYDQYNADAKKNLAKAEIHGFSLKQNASVDLVAKVFFEAYGKHYAKSDELKILIKNCCELAIEKKKGFVRAVYGPDDELWCAGFFFYSNKRIHYAMAAPTDSGKKHGATHILIDEVIKEFAGKKIVFDFEGSDIDSVAYFYAKFGSTPNYYLQIVKNNLPWWCRFLKQ